MRTEKVIVRETVGTHSICLVFPYLPHSHETGCMVYSHDTGWFWIKDISLIEENTIPVEENTQALIMTMAELTYEEFNIAFITYEQYKKEIEDEKTTQ